MGGRGRGRGGANSGGLTFEQLQSMGVTRGEMGAGGGGSSGVVPPPLFPKLEARPLPLQTGASMDYMLILKSQFMDYLHDSPSHVQTTQLKCDVERYSDKYKVLSTDGKGGRGVGVCWEHLPAELRPHHRAKKTPDTRKRKGKTVTDINSKLKKLEQKELMEENHRKEADGEETEKGEGLAGEETREEEENEVVGEEEDPDEEMDDGTDYVDNYFDNGEGFEDDEENLDDGPVY